MLCSRTRLVVPAVALAFAAGAALTWSSLRPERAREENAALAAEPAAPVAAAEAPPLPAERAGDAPEATRAARELSAAFVAAAKRVRPAVVHVNVVRTVAAPAADPLDLFGDDFFRRFFGEPRPRGRSRSFQQPGQGSGTIVRAEERKGYILTNNHVVGGANKITVVLADGRELEAKLVGADPRSDIAVVEIEAEELPSAALADSDRIEVGQIVLAVGSPFGLDQTVTSGIVSAKGRSNVRITEYRDFIQTDAAINPGNSGGPLVNLRGEIIGVNTAIYSRSGGYMGIGFAIPSNIARVVMEDLIRHGRVTYGYLGVSIQDLTAPLAKHLGLAETKGALVSDVVKKSPAEEAGLKSGDVVVEFAGRAIDGADALRNAAGITRPGMEVPITVVRDGKRLTFRVKVAEQTKDLVALERGGEAMRKFERFGLTVEPTSAALRKRYRLPAAAEGLLVTEVAPGSPAARAGFEPGVLIEEVNREEVRTLEDFRRALGRNKDEALLRIRLGRHVQYVVLKLK